MKRLILCLSIILIFGLLLPVYVELFETPAGKEAWYFTMFLTINPIISALLGFLSGLDIKKLWFIPLLNAIAFPILFWISVLEADLDMFSYLVIYLPVGLCSMAITAFAKRMIKKTN